jgi:inositol 1,4,5-triphosphate receptor type 3
VISIDNGLIAGGGFGDFLLPMSYNSENAGRYAVRWVYDVFFFMVVKMAFLNIIFGIIIDSFAELRDNRKVMEEDMSTICFICGIERDKVLLN